MGRLTRQIIDTVLLSIPMLFFAALMIAAFMLLAGCSSKKTTTIETIPEITQERATPVATPSPAPSRPAQQEPAPAPLFKARTETVYFQFDRAALSWSARETIRVLMASLGDYSGRCFAITGGACPIGNGLYNWELGKRRAEAVAGHLEELYGVGACVDVFSVGETGLVCKTPDCYSQNRRVEIEVR